MIQSCDEQALAFGIQFGEQVSDSHCPLLETEIHRFDRLQYCASAGVSVSIPSALGEATATASADQTAASSSAAQADPYVSVPLLSFKITH